jgi:hypothetical protein
LHVKKLALVGILAVAGVAASANAFEYRVRFVERVGTTDTVLDGNTIEYADQASTAARRIRVQFGVFDDAAGAAPAGGFLGWNVGTVTVNGGAGNSDESRTNGRITPWNFAPNGNGNPAADPFEALTGIDNTLGTQSPPWPDGSPRPAATIRGLNTYVSTYEITINPTDGTAESYTIDFGGNVLAAIAWNIIQENPPEEGNPGTIVYAPNPTQPSPFTATLNVRIIPAPGAAALLGLGGLVALRRRR